MTLPNGRRAHDDARPTWRPIPAWRWMLAALAAVVITAVVVIIWLYTIAGHAKPGTDQANARLDAVRSGLAAGAGAGAAVGLMLAFRRQHHQEIATDLTDRDATERRITELYTKAVEQLGSEKAPVRLGGLYALERLAQDNPAHRQTIANVICAYLRMPFSLTAPIGKLEPEATEDPGEPAAETEMRTNGNGGTWHQERQVRLAAQRILAEHLRDDRAKNQRSTESPSAHFWPDIRLDLADATLIDFDFRNGVMAAADFQGATFSGDALFTGATFSGDVWFRGAIFSSGAWFDGATFSGYARFITVIFSNGASFIGTTFSGTAVFLGATFSSDALFNGATFSSDADFPHATFTGGAWFNRATFSGRAEFVGGTFSSIASFDETTFSGAEDSLSFRGSHVLAPDTQPAWPTGWCLAPDGSGGYTVVRANGDGRS